MIRFWAQVRQVPRALIFVGQRKISRDGYRWAPRSLMGGVGVGLDLKDRSGTVTQMGLKGTWWMYQLRMRTSVTVPFREEMAFLDNTSDRLLRLRDSTDNSGFTVTATDSVIIFLDKPASTGEVCLGAIHTRVTVGHEGTVAYRFEGLMGAEMCTRSIFGMSGFETDRLWRLMRQSARGTFSERHAEILIR